MYGFVTTLIISIPQKFPNHKFRERIVLWRLLTTLVTLIVKPFADHTITWRCEVWACSVWVPSYNKPKCQLYPHISFTKREEGGKNQKIFLTLSTTQCFIHYPYFVIIVNIFYKFEFILVTKITHASTNGIIFRMTWLKFFLSILWDIIRH